MSIERFAGFYLKKVFEDAEAERARLLAEEERRKRREALDEKVKGRRSKVESSAKSVYPVQEAQSPVSNSSFYEGLEWQLRAFREPRTSEKTLFFYDDGLAQVVSAGFERHPSSNEVFSLICDYLDDETRAAAGEKRVLNTEQTKVVKDMLESYGEFFNQAVKTSITGKLKRKKQVIFYENVTKLPWNGEEYVKGDLKYSGQPRVFDASDLKFGDYNTLKDFYQEHPDLVEYLYSRRFEQLPEKIKDNEGIYLPETKQMWPVGRGDFGFYVGSYSYWASRGVRPRAPAVKV